MLLAAAAGQKTEPCCLARIVVTASVRARVVPRRTHACLASTFILNRVVRREFVAHASSGVCFCNPIDIGLAKATRAA